MSKIKSKMLTRSMEIRSFDVDKKTVDLTFSSEEPVQRWWGVEILDHSPKSVNMDRLRSGKAALLLEHWEQIGVVERAEIKGKIGHATVRFSESVKAQEIFKDIETGIRSCVSVGYRVKKMKQEDSDPKNPIFRATDWQPYEISVVSIPADINVGIKRSDNLEEDIEIVNENKRGANMKMNMKMKRSHTTNEPDDEEEQDLPEKTFARNYKSKNVSGSPEMSNAEKNKIKEEMRKAEITRIREIEAMGETFGKRDLARSHIEQETTIDEFRKIVLDDMEDQNKKRNANIPVNPMINNRTLSDMGGVTQKDLQGFSVLRAINSLRKNRRDLASLEWDISDEIRHQGRLDGGDGLIIPHQALLRSQSVSVQTAGGYLVADNMMPNMFVNVLRNATQVLRMGATLLEGLQGNITIPKQNSGSQAYWVGEGMDSTESDNDFGQIKMTAKKIKTEVVTTDELLRQSSIAVEDFTREDIIKSIILGIDKAALSGSGVGEEPLGIINTSGVGSVTISAGAPTYNNMVDLKSQVAIDNALFGNTGFLLNARDQGILEKTKVDEGSGQFVWTYAPSGTPDQGRIVGQNALITNQLANDRTVFGNWSSLMIGLWSGIELFIDPYSQRKKDKIIIDAKQYCDIAVRYPQSFSVTNV